MNVGLELAAPKHIIVEIDPAGNWQEVCRGGHRLVAAESGRDTVTLRLRKVGLEIVLNGGNVVVSDAVSGQLKQLAGVHRVVRGSWICMKPLFNCPV